MATVLEKVQKLTYEENFAMALCQVFTSIKNSIISENLVLLTQNEQFRAKSAHIRPAIVKNALIPGLDTCSMFLFHSHCLISYREGLGRIRTFTDKQKQTWRPRAMPLQTITNNLQDVPKGASSKYQYTFEFIKDELQKGKIESLDREALSKCCDKLQLKTSGSKGELIARLLPLKVILTQFARLGHSFIHLIE